MRRARTLLLIATLALNGLVTLCGPSLHAIVGLEHGAILVGSGGADEGTSGRLGASHDDCPLCHHAALAAIVVDARGDLALDVVALRPADEPPAPLPSKPDGPSSPRAPPRA